MEDIDGGLHPAVDGQSLDEDEDEDLHKNQQLLPIYMVRLCTRNSSYLMHMVHKHYIWNEF